MRNWIIVVALLLAPAPAFTPVYVETGIRSSISTRATKQLVWRGTGADTLSDKPEKKQRR